MTDAVSLSNYIGKRITIRIPAFKDGQLTEVLLRGVDPGGIWFESGDFMEELLKATPHKMTQASAVIFVPFAQIVAIYDFVGGGPWISERVGE